MSDEVADYLAARKAKRANQKGKFKTFSATAVFIATDAGTEEEGELREPPSPPSQLASNSSNVSNGAPTPTSATLVAGEWIDDEVDNGNQPRLTNYGVSDLETSNGETEDRRTIEMKVEQEDARKQFHSSRAAAPSDPGLANSAWAKVDQDAVVQQPPKNAWGANPVAETPRENPWQTKAPKPAPARASPVVMGDGPAPASVSGDGRDPSTGLKRTANAWQPKSRGRN